MAPRKGVTPPHLKKTLWPKGVSGNPNGRPKGTTVSDILRRRAKELIDSKDPKFKKFNGMTPDEAVAEIIILNALSGVGDDLDRYLDRKDGKVAQKVTLDAPRPMAHLGDEELLAAHQKMLAAQKKKEKRG